MTWEELIKLPQDTSVIHTSTHTTGIIHIEHNNFFFLSDDGYFNGSRPEDMKGFTYGWWICNSNEHYAKDGREVYKLLEIM